VHSELPWYAIRVRSNFEQSVAGTLRWKGYEEFLPTYRVRRRWSDRTQEIDRPLFSGYVFCRLDVQARLPVLIIPGVVSLVGFGKAAVPIPGEEITAVRAIMNSGLLACRWPFLQEGHRIRLTRGALTNLEGFLIKVKNQWRVVVSIMLLQRSVSVEVDAEWVEPVPLKSRILAPYGIASEGSAARDLRF